MVVAEGLCRPPWSIPTRPSFSLYVVSRGGAGEKSVNGSHHILLLKIVDVAERRTNRKHAISLRQGHQYDVSTMYMPAHMSS